MTFTGAHARPRTRSQLRAVLDERDESLAAAEALIKRLRGDRDAVAARADADRRDAARWRDAQSATTATHTIPAPADTRHGDEPVAWERTDIRDRPTMPIPVRVVPLQALDAITLANNLSGGAK